jgi:hypothetical protein
MELVAKNHSNLLAFRNIALQPAVGATGCVTYGIEETTRDEVESRIRAWQTKAFARLCMAAWGASTAYELEQKVTEAQGRQFYADERPKAVDRMLHPGSPGMARLPRIHKKPNASAAMLMELKTRNSAEFQVVGWPLWRLLDPRQLLPDELDVFDHRLRELGAPPPIPLEMGTAEERRMFVNFYYVHPKKVDAALGLARMLWELRCKEAVAHVGHYVELVVWLKNFCSVLGSPVIHALAPDLRSHLEQCFGRICFPLVDSPRDLKELRWALRRLGVQLRAADGAGSQPSEYRFRLLAD